jgi:effector-binding domain-containing protein
MMNASIRLSSAALLLLCCGANAAGLALVSLPETTVLAVAPSSNRPADYAAAFGKLVGFYALPDRTFKTVFPQMSLSLNERSYAAIAITGTPQTQPGIEVLVLPPCQFARQTYVGNYPGLAPAVESMVAAAAREGLTVDRGCGIRILHANSPDDTPVEKLAHEIYVPLVKRQP